MNKRYEEYRAMLQQLSKVEDALIEAERLYRVYPLMCAAATGLKVGDRVQLTDKIRRPWKGHGWWFYREMMFAGNKATVASLDFNEHDGKFHVGVIFDHEFGVAEDGTKYPHDSDREKGEFSMTAEEVEKIPEPTEPTTYGTMAPCVWCKVDKGVACLDRCPRVLPGKLPDPIPGVVQLVQ